MERILLLMRHGLYEKPAHAPQGILTEDGQRNSDDVARQITEDNLVPDLILHSPIGRVKETAYRAYEVFSLLGKRPEIKEAYWLSETISTMPHFLESLPDDKRVVLLATHVPNIAVLTDEFRDSQCPDYSNACVFTQNSASWGDFISPKLMKKYIPRPA